tara:strand:+ start:492 stop:1226 length:735 start_codon:yes stop_codon:yes gene_type:complete
MKPTYRFTFAHPIFNKKNLKVKSGTYSRGGGVYYVDSIYYLWFCFLKISEEYNEICDNKGHSNKLKNTVYKDFADVKKYTFKYWWNEKINKKGLIRGEFLFGAQRYMNVFETATALNDENNVTVTIPLSISKRAIASEVKKIVNKHHKAIRGHNFKNVLKAKYTPKFTSTNPKIKSLQKILMLKRVKQKHLNKTHKELWTICKNMNNNFAKGESYEGVESKNSTVSRMLRRYKQIDSGLSLGIF